MDISNHIQKIKKRFEDNDPEFFKIKLVFSLYINDFSRSSYNLSYGKIFLKNIHPLEKVSLLLKKDEILLKLRDQGFVIHDIL